MTPVTIRRPMTMYEVRDKNTVVLSTKYKPTAETFAKQWGLTVWKISVSVIERELG